MKKSEYIGLAEEKTPWQEAKPFGKLFIGFLILTLFLEWAALSFLLDLIPTKYVIILTGLLVISIFVLLYLRILFELGRIRRKL